MLKNMLICVIGDIELSAAIALDGYQTIAALNTERAMSIEVNATIANKGKLNKDEWCVVVVGGDDRDMRVAVDVHHVLGVRVLQLAPTSNPNANIQTILSSDDLSTRKSWVMQTLGLPFTPTVPIVSTAQVGEPVREALTNETPSNDGEADRVADALEGNRVVDIAAYREQHKEGNVGTSKDVKVEEVDIDDVVDIPAAVGETHSPQADYIHTHQAPTSNIEPPAIDANVTASTVGNVSQDATSSPSIGENVATTSTYTQPDQNSSSPPAATPAPTPTPPPAPQVPETATAPTAPPSAPPVSPSAPTAPPAPPSAPVAPTEPTEPTSAPLAPTTPTEPPDAPMATPSPLGTTPPAPPVADYLSPPSINQSTSEGEALGSSITQPSSAPQSIANTNSAPPPIANTEDAPQNAHIETSQSEAESLSSTAGTSTPTTNFDSSRTSQPPAINPTNQNMGGGVDDSLSHITTPSPGSSPAPPYSPTPIDPVSQQQDPPPQNTDSNMPTQMDQMGQAAQADQRAQADQISSGDNISSAYSPSSQRVVETEKQTAQFAAAPWQTPKHSANGQFIAITAAKGGVGKSTTSLWIAEALNAAGVKTIAVEGNVVQPDLLKITKSWDATHLGILKILHAQGADFSNQELREAIKHVEGLGDVLPGPPSGIQEPQDSTLRTLLKAIERLKYEYEIIIVDTPVASVWEVATDRLVREADLVVMIATPQEFIIHDTVEFFAQATKPRERGGMGIDPNKFIGVLNSRNDADGIDLEKVQAWIPALPFQGSIPKIVNHVAAHNKGKWKCPPPAQPGVQAIAAVIAGDRVAEYPSMIAASEKERGGETKKTWGKKLLRR